jgi:mannose-6-phosphate isomerase
MWMGTHCGAPSQVRSEGNLVSLAELSGGELPFLVKLLAVEKPLSIQAHPDKAQAEEGFRRENEEGLSLDSPRRNYKDPNHKPEILCAITPFTVMAGFREPSAVYKSLKGLLSAAPQLGETLAPLLSALKARLRPLEVFLRALYGLSKQELESFCSFFSEKEHPAQAVSDEQWKLVKSFALQYPGDALVLSPFFINLFALQPFQAVFIPAGILHSYISGFGLELMASSDNVLRGGLTPKHTDTGELMKILKFDPFVPEITVPPAPPWGRYPAPCVEFSLSILRGSGEKIFPENGPAICIVTDGELFADGQLFKRGESFFVPAGRNGRSLFFNGDYSMFAASAQA